MPLMPFNTTTFFPAPLSVIFCLSLILCGCTTQEESLPPVAAPPVTNDFSAPRLVRFLSSEKPFAGMECFGVVLSDNDGIPALIINMGSVDSSLCIAAGSELPMPLIKKAFHLADVRGLHKIPTNHELLVEQVGPHELGRLLPPVPVTMKQLEKQQRFIIGAGLNYNQHREEVAAAEPLLLFPKFIAPSGAYQDVEAGLQLDDASAVDVMLLDFEVELGVVLLDDVDLFNLPEAEIFRHSIAFFVSNDISDREPIILDQQYGYTKGKSHTSYLPTGPWMIHGRHLSPLTANQKGKDNLELGLRVFDKNENNHGLQLIDSRLAQNDTTFSMHFGPWEILHELSKRLQAGERISMADAQGISRYLHTEQGIIPAGSLLLTGTPGGTAIKSPGLWQKIRLFVTGGLSKEGARQQYVLDSEEKSDALGYLQPGDTVECWISGLGRQRWQVVSSEL
ncbi:MAG: fumarylacetoacetate hydrolase family protein [Thermodesulfobacteriota bacterium]|nr:fumarylacetoacetate hydrolase family protein [Thermodesulfobacteriota bacterium]